MCWTTCSWCGWCEWWFEIKPLIMWGHPHDMQRHALIILEVAGCLYKKKVPLDISCSCGISWICNHEDPRSHIRVRAPSTDAVTKLAHGHQMAGRTLLDHSPSNTHASKPSYVLTFIKTVDIFMCSPIACFWDMDSFVRVASWSIGISFNSTKINILVVMTHHQESRRLRSITALIWSFLCSGKTSQICVDSRIMWIVGFVFQRRTDKNRPDSVSCVSHSPKMSLSGHDTRGSIRTDQLKEFLKYYNHALLPLRSRSSNVDALSGRNVPCSHPHMNFRIFWTSKAYVLSSWSFGVGGLAHCWTVSIQRRKFRLPRTSAFLLKDVPKQRNAGVHDTDLPPTRKRTHWKNRHTGTKKQTHRKIETDTSKVTDTVTHVRLQDVHGSTQTNTHQQMSARKQDGTTS